MCDECVTREELGAIPAKRDERIEDLEETVESQQETIES